MVKVIISRLLILIERIQKKLSTFTSVVVCATAGTVGGGMSLSSLSSSSCSNGSKEFSKFLNYTEV